MTDMVLGDMEIWVLESLIEKSLATPEYYPLSLNALENLKKISQEFKKQF